jgi:CheY-like chemotaxis protein
METHDHESHLILIDDDRDIVTTVSKALHDIGWRVTACQDATQAHQLVAHEQPDVVLLDIHLEGLASGWRVLEALRSDAGTRNVPVIVFTSQIKELEEKEAWLLEQQISVLSKPFELDDLYDAAAEYQRPRQSLGQISADRG